MNRNDQLKAIFAQAFDVTVGCHSAAFAEANVEQVKSSLRADMTKLEITQQLDAGGVKNARDIAQVILAVGNRLDR